MKDKYLYKDEFTAGIPLTQTEQLWAVRAAPKDFLDSSEKLVMVMLITRDGNQGVFPSFDTISKDTSLSKRTVATKVQTLETKGWLKIDHGIGTVNDYVILVPEYVQRVVKTSIRGKQYITFIYPPVQPLHYTSATTALPPVQPLHSKKEREDINLSGNGSDSGESSLATEESLSTSAALVSPAFCSPSVARGQQSTSGSATIARVEDDPDDPLYELFNPPPLPKVLYYKTDRPRHHWDKPYRLAGNSKPRPGETEIWLDAADADELGIE